MTAKSTKKSVSKKSATKTPAAKKSAAKTPAARKPGPAPKPPRAPGERRYWLVKTEPESFSWDDLWNAPARTTCWDGVRNYTARNTLRDDMKLGDLVLVYHSSTDPTGIVGLAEVAREGYPDHTQFEKGHHHYDPGAKPENPPWVMVDLRAVRKLPFVSLETLKNDARLAGLPLLMRGQRLSVQPVSREHFVAIVGSES